MFGRPRRGRPLTAAKRNAILEGAADVFSQTPFEDVLVDDVARRARVGKGTLYRYFASKEDLYLGLVVARLPELRRRIDAVLQGEEPLKAKLVCVARETIGFLWSEPLFVSLIPKKAGEPRKTDPLWEEQRDALRRRLAEILGRGDATVEPRKLDPHRASIYFFGLVRSAALNRRPSDTPETLAGEAVEFFLNGLGAASATSLETDDTDDTTIA